VNHPIDAHESERIEWVHLDDVPRLIAAGDIRAAHTVAALLTLRQLRATGPQNDEDSGVVNDHDGQSRRRSSRSPGP
jgi:hypothetical protein